MAAVFARFRDWLVGVYHSIKQLDVQLNPSIQSVFDRLLGGAERDVVDPTTGPGTPPSVDMRPPSPEAPPDGINIAEAHVAAQEPLAQTVREAGMDNAPDYPERQQINRLRNEGRLGLQDQEAMSQMDTLVAQADNYAKALVSAFGCF
jgi:hypothetical protein